MCESGGAPLDSDLVIIRHTPALLNAPLAGSKSLGKVWEIDGNDRICNSMYFWKLFQSLHLITGAEFNVFHNSKY